MASLLETFFILFESNADKVKQGSEEARKSTDSLEQSLGSADRMAENVGESIIETFKEVAIAVGAAFTFERIKEGILDAAKETSEMARAANRLGLEIEEVDAWSKAIVVAGGSASDFTATVSFLEKNLAAVDAMGKARILPFLDLLGVHLDKLPSKGKNIQELLLAISEGLSKKTAGEAAGIAERLGISEGLLALLRKGRVEVAALLIDLQKHGVATREDAAAAEAWRIANVGLNDAIGDTFREIGTKLLPAWTDATQAIKGGIEYLSEHRGLVEGFFIGVAGVVTAVYGPAMVSAAAATIAATWPILAIGAAVAGAAVAFALAYDDLQSFLAGNKSVIGELSKKWPVYGEMIRAEISAIGSAFEWLQHIAVPVFEIVGSVMRIAWQVGLHSVIPLINGVIVEARKIAPIFEAAAYVITRAFQPVVWLFQHLDVLLGQIAKNVEWIGGLLSRLPVPEIDWMGSIPRAPESLGLAKNHSAAASASVFNTPQLSAIGGPSGMFGWGGFKGGNTNTVNVQPGAVVVNTNATDAEDVGRVVHGTLQEQLRQAAAHFDDGVKG